MRRLLECRKLFFLSPAESPFLIRLFQECKKSVCRFDEMIHSSSIRCTNSFLLRMEKYWQILLLTCASFHQHSALLLCVVCVPRRVFYILKIVPDTHSITMNTSKSQMRREISQSCYIFQVGQRYTAFHSECAMTTRRLQMIYVHCDFDNKTH